MNERRIWIRATTRWSCDSLGYCQERFSSSGTNSSISNQGSPERRPVTKQPSIHDGSSRTFCFSLFELSLLSQQWRRRLGKAAVEAQQ
uniref:Uncharacterized protein n=1 Tax=Arachis hypogaea TaxID=3818 RepID=N1NF13_ARAHY|nr:hypothetical protein ARAX_AHF417E07-019 [Arachis hypogaea]